MKTVVKWDTPLILRVLKKHLIAIVILAIAISGLATFAISYLHKPTYTTEVQLSQNDNNVAQISVYSQYIETTNFKKLLNSRIKNSKWKDSKDSYSISISSQNNSAFFVLDATSTNAKFSQFVANSAMQVFTTSVGRYVSGANITLVSAGTLNETPNTINIPKTAGVFLLFGLVIGFVIMMFREIFSGVILDRKFISETYGVKYLGELQMSKNNNQA